MRDEHGTNGLLFVRKLVLGMTHFNIVEKARAFAAAKHDGQEGKRPHEPYIQHIHNVVELLGPHGSTPEVVAAAYLHDCLEKTDTTIAELIREFGEDVTELVYWLTDPEDSEPEKELLSAWLLGRAPIGAKLIKLADIIDNGQAIRSHQPAKLTTFRRGKRAILERMATVEGDAFKELALYTAALDVTR
jgi:(p)ppGpp synthase/HD superfamily hydrolase